MDRNRISKGAKDQENYPQRTSLDSLSAPPAAAPAGNRNAEGRSGAPESAAPGGCDSFAALAVSRARQAATHSAACTFGR